LVGQQLGINLGQAEEDEWEIDKLKIIDQMNCESNHMEA